METPKKYKKINVLGLVRLEGDFTLKEVLWIMAAALVIVIIIIVLLKFYSIPALATTGTINNIEAFIKFVKLRGP